MLAMIVGGLPKRRPDRSSPQPPPPPTDRDPGLRGLAGWPFWLVLTLTLLLGAAAVSSAYIGLGELVLVDETRPITPSQRITASFAVATALGVLVALVVNLRKQDLAEQAARLEISAAFIERFRSAAAQLGGTSAAERIAGVYAMAALADGYPSRRQQCVDVLCGYLRLPFDPATDHLAERSTTTTQVFHDGKTVVVSHTAPSAPFGQQVRETITTLIRDHTQPDSSPSWSDLSFDLFGAHLSNLNLKGSRFCGKITSFERCTFSGRTTSFEEATFSSEEINFKGATFSADITSFSGAMFAGEQTSFRWAKFFGEEATFDHATFSSEKQTSFEGATFAVKETGFAGVSFASAHTSFALAKFSGDATYFYAATFWGETSFAYAMFRRVRITFSEAQFSIGAEVTGLDRPQLLREGATITRDKAPFKGWPAASPL